MADVQLHEQGPDLLARRGWAVVDEVLAAASIRALLCEYERALDSFVDRPALPVTTDDLPERFVTRYLDLVRATGRTFSQALDVSLPRVGVEADTPMHLSSAAFELLRHPRLLDVVESVLGPEIFVSPIQHVRIKPPESLVRSDGGLLQGVPWHQDQAVVAPEALDAEVLTVWVPLTPATLDNGCLEVISGSHLRGSLQHCPGTSTRNGGVAPRLVEGEPTPVPMEPGSVLLMDRHLLHRARPNRTTDEVRISLDLRYQRLGDVSARPAFPGFVGRSRANPPSELHDAGRWRDDWLAARERIAACGGVAAPTRWSGDHPICA